MMSNKRQVKKGENTLIERIYKDFDRLDAKLKNKHMSCYEFVHSGAGHNTVQFDLR